MNERRTDFELLREFVRWGDQPAFAAVVRGHLDLVYATALRKVEDRGAAEEVTQNVFAVLARKAWRFAPDDSLPAWLYRTTLLEAKAWLRGELRRRRREQTAAELGTTMKTPDEQPALLALVPLLDEALLSLREKDRTALLLRYCESRPLREVGALLGVGEDAAQKRVAGALQQLAQFFQRRGFRTATIAATTAALQHTAASAPAMVATSVVQAAMHVAPPAFAGTTALLSRVVGLTKIQKAVLCAALVAVPAVWHWNEVRKTEKEEVRKQAEFAAATAQAQRLQGAARVQVHIEETARKAAVIPQLEPVAMRATENSPVEKTYATRLTGIIDLPGFKAALLEVNYSVTNELHESRGGQLVVLTNYVSVHTNYLFLTEGRPNLEHLLDTNLKEVVFEVSQIDSETGEVRAREDGREVVYAFESQDGRKANVRLQCARWQDVLKLLGGCLDRTVLCHPALEQSAISMAAFARDKMDAAVDLEMALKEKGISTLPDGDKFELVVPDELAQSATKTVGPAYVVANPKDELMPKGEFQWSNANLSQVLVIYGELIGRKLAQQNRLAGSPMFLVTQTPLTKTEMIHALDTLLGWQGLKVVIVDGKSFKVVRAPTESNSGKRKK